MTAVDFSKFVEDLASLSGDIIIPFFRSSIGAEDKSRGGAFDPVTEADRAAESAIRRKILEAFPDHGIIGEEFGDHNPDAEYVWLIDPIDGTKSFVSGLPLWGTLIGLRRRDKAVYGLMHQPFIRERFLGDGKVAYWRGLSASSVAIEKILRTRDCHKLAQATIMTTSPLLLDDAQREKYRRVEKATRLHRYGGDCYAYCMLAAGFVDVVIEAGLKPYDVAALIPIVEGAGGVITTWDGGSAHDGGAVIAAGDRRIHAEALRLLA